MKSAKQYGEKEQEVPDALGNDKRQGKNMPKAGHGDKTFVKKDGEKAKDNKRHKNDTAGNP